MLFGAIVFCGILIAVLAGAIACAESKDRRENERSRRMMKDAAKCRGIIRKIENLEAVGVRCVYPWRVTIEFEYEGERYSIEEKIIAKPTCAVGGKVTVCVDKLDPWKSRAFI